MGRNKRQKTATSSGSEGDDDVFTKKLGEDLIREMSDMRKEVADVKKVVDDMRQIVEAKDDRIDDLEQEVMTLRRRIMQMEDRSDEAEAYSRRDTVVVSGSDLPAAVDRESPIQVVCDTLKTRLNLDLRQCDISVAHRIGSRPPAATPDRRNIIIKLCRRETKRQIFEACRAVKPKNFFVNESLTPTRNCCAYGLRQAKKRFPNIVAGYGSLDGKVYVLIKPPNPNAPNAFYSRMWINTKTNFIDLCTKIIKCDHTTIVNKWPGDQ